MPLSHEETRIPLALRSWIYRSFRRQPLHSLGLSYYSYWAKWIGKRLQDTLPEADVLWTGGAIERCVPGVSDLDFVVLQDSVDWTPDSWEAVKQAIRPMPYLPLGEIHLSTPKLWNYFLANPPAAALWFYSQRVFSGGKWVRLLRGESVKPSAASRLAIALHHYCRAIDLLSECRGPERLFYRAGFIREISKAIAYAQGEGVKRLLNGSAELLLSQAFLALRGVGHQALRDMTAEESQPQVWRGDPALRFATELVHRRLERKLRDFPELNLRSGDIPRLFVWPYQGNGLVPTFEDYVRYIHQGGDHKHGLAYLVPPEAYETCLLGWSWGSLEEAVRFIPLERESDEGWQAVFQAQMKARAKERGLLELVTLPGNLIFLSRAKVDAKLAVLSEALHFACPEQKAAGAEITKLRSLLKTQAKDREVYHHAQAIYGILVEAFTERQI